MAMKLSAKVWEPPTSARYESIRATSMNDTIETRLNQTIRMVFGDYEIVVDRTTSAPDVEGWDSLTHINLIVAIEREFKIRFTTAEVQGMKNVGDLIDSIAGKIA